MKPTRLALPGRFLAVSLLLSAGCSREKPAATAEGPKPAPAPSAAPAASPAPGGIAPANDTSSDPFAEMKGALDRATLDNHDGLADLQQRMDQEMDARVAAKKASADVQLAADQKLDAASADFAEKLRMLSVARPETWNTAKDNAMQALNAVRSAYADVMNSPARR